MKKTLFLTTIIMASAFAADLPVKEVVLYKHGVGFLQRMGDLKPGDTVRLDFKASEMNDVLKSLTVSDSSGAPVRGLRYDSSEPLSQKLSEFPFRLAERQSLSALLDQLKGTMLQLRYGQETVSGRIVGGRVTPAGEQQPEKERVTLLLDSGELRTLDLEGATAIRLQDSELQGLLGQYLSALNQARSREKRSVYIDSAGNRDRQITVGYVIPTPIWKSSYRLIFDDSDRPTLEGWAIVDNTTGEDWTDVRLALVSGRPISFISKLYEPRLVQRPTAELPEERAQAPVIHAGVVGDRLEEEQGEPAVEMKAKNEQLRLGMAAPMRAMSRDERGDSAPTYAAEVVNMGVVASSVAATAEGRDLGELFEYRLPEPVTVRKNESAMLPFLQQEVTGRKLLIYTNSSSQNPLNAAEITNSTGKTLDGGPVTVFEAGAYAGEALMETVKTGDKRLVSYGIDLGTRVTTQFESGKDIVREIHYRRGILTTRRAVQEIRTYTIRNVDQKAKVLVVEHSQRPEYKLLNQKPAETTAAAYRFEVKLEPGATEKFPVIEERVFENSVAITNLTPDVLASFVQNKALDEKARAQLEQVAGLKRQLADADTATRQVDQDINELVNDQNRLRQNISSLNRVSGQQEQVQSYARQLASQESQLASLRDSLSELRKKNTALQAELNDLIEKMEF